MVNVFELSKRIGRGLHFLRVVILTWKRRNDISSQNLKGWKWKIEEFIWREFIGGCVSRGKRFKTLVMNEEGWIPFELKPRDIERRFWPVNYCFNGNKEIVIFLYRIVTSNQCIQHRDNSQRRK